MDRKKNISIAWTKGLSKEDKDTIESLLRNNTIIVNRLRKILAERFDYYKEQELDIEDYDIHSWGYKQADRNGAKRELNYLYDLFNFLD